MDKLEKTDKMMFDKLEALHCLNKWEVLFIIWYCNFYLHLDFIKSKAREREARENGAGVTHSGSTGTCGNNSVTCRGHDDGSKIYTSDRTTLMPRKTSSLVTSTNGTQTIEFREYNKHRREAFGSDNVSGPGKVSERNDKRFGTTKSV
ncbi:uncharacterized protein OCT59_019297 [Rhizophagus irregularis]|uniref:Uncharacterized protein n=1 Tax=Rhizophagus irregularis TaxID=588596 RepID=A0A916EHY1_9GLOM|nr:hypothetical protein OCT59_019297 [Rhizophagus irregularis]CAB4471344.1 unnamed protein product [Rhizophagus irregularis]CAB5198658.1 unnamed protein product [Rhizophagus irregularis]CAB5392599.1 unnamed protein product [Rhizophagus irregularis]